MERSTIRCGMTVSRAYRSTGSMSTIRCSAPQPVEAGLDCRLVAEGDHYDYLAQLSLERTNP